MTACQEIVKRDGAVVEFDRRKITAAIKAAFAAAGSEMPEGLPARVEGLAGGSERRGVEDIQDLVESTLIGDGHAGAAKAYVLYRYERRKIRSEKMRVLNAEQLDPVAKKFDLDCLRVLASRYLLRDGKNEITETPAGLFERIALLVGIGDMMYDPLVFAGEGGSAQDGEEARSYLGRLDSFDRKFRIGGYHLNKYHFRSLINHYAELAGRGVMTVSFRQLLALLANRMFDGYAGRIKEYFDLMVSQDFLPNSPTMMNAGGRLGQLSACFVLDVSDSLEDIMQTVSRTAAIFQSGGGVGINYSPLREEGAAVTSTSGVASGPVSFMNIINTVTEVVKQGGKRRGANMGILESWHPDIEKFITAKTEPGVLENFNVSVGVGADFWEALGGDGRYLLRSPVDGGVRREVDAGHLLALAAHSAWRSAEPGLVFLDQVNKYNIFAKARGGPLRATNPCGEQSLYPYESCNLGSINLSNLVKEKAGGVYEFDWQRYEEVIRKTTRFLDNVIDVNRYPAGEITEASAESRRIGLGVMGVADLLYKLRIPYNSEEGYGLQSRLAEALTYHSMDESVSLAESRGEFPLCPRTEFPEGKIPVAGYYERPREEHSFDWNALIGRIKKHGIRNVLTTTVAPTGTLSMIADCTNGMEPTFALVFEKRVTVGRFFYTNKTFEQVLRDNGLYSDELIARIAGNHGSVQGLDGIPGWIQRVFVTAMDIHWADHLAAQSAWQQWMGNAIAKTINMPHDATADDVRAAYLLAHEMGLKGITVYRDGSRHKQVLHAAGGCGGNGRPSPRPSSRAGRLLQKIGASRKHVRPGTGDGAPCAGPHAGSCHVPLAADAAAAGGGAAACPECGDALVHVENCATCISCGHSGCGT